MSYSCSQCDKKYANSGQLTHTGEKPYSCDLCDKRFSVAATLKVHMRTHTGEKLYSCIQCDKRFTQASDLKVHMRTHYIRPMHFRKLYIIF